MKNTYIFESTEDKEFIKICDLLEKHGWKEDEEEEGHTHYIKGALTYSACCQYLWDESGRKPMSRKKFAQKYLNEIL